MSDLIKLLPDSVANQIAAGEVIQRPASVVKELVENAIDAKATEITINIIDAGRTLIQIIDNGFGMSETDARLSFERHSTSKLKHIDDLFSLKTMGFRGEALASVSSVAQVILKTKREEDELGIEINISGSQVEKQELVNCQKGCNFQVKNLFYNVPARRKFLKSDGTEFRHILEEVQRVVLTNIDVSFKLFHNKTEVLNLPNALLRQRIVNVFGKNLNTNLISIENNTDIVEISGFIGKPDKAKKQRGEQYFFVNNRFMKHPYFYHAVKEAYKNIIASDTHPSFFIYLKVKPEAIDINIHPTKTEIKFEEERFIYQLIQVTVKQSLGRFNLTPSIDFDVNTDFELPVTTTNQKIELPKISYNPDYNPLESKSPEKTKIKDQDYFNKTSTKDWEKLFTGENKETQEELFSEDFIPNELVVFSGKYAIFSNSNKLIFINLRLALYQINYELFINLLVKKQASPQKLMFQEEMELSLNDYLIINEMYDNLLSIGFDFKEVNVNTIEVTGIPGELENIDTRLIIEELIESYKINSENVKDNINNLIAETISKSLITNKYFDTESARFTIEKLYKAKQYNYTANGKKIIKILEKSHIDNLFI
jgi:DNA mismatch repair protein MutL